MDPLDEELAERGRLLIAAAVAETTAPLALRERIEADTRRAGKSGARPRSRGVMGWLLPAGGLVAAAAVVLALVLGGGAGAPSVLATAALATGGPVLPAPQEDSSNGAVLKASMGGVPFPYWGDSFQWEAVGARDDKIKDRSARTVFYDNPKGARAAYTILGGDDDRRALRCSEAEPQRDHAVHHPGQGQADRDLDARRSHLCVECPARRARAEAARAGELEGQGQRSFLSDPVPPRHAAAPAARPAPGGAAAARWAVPARAAPRLGAPAAPRPSAARGAGGAPAPRVGLSAASARADRAPPDTVRAWVACS